MEIDTSRPWRSSNEWKYIETTLRSLGGNCYLCKQPVDVNQPRFFKTDDGSFLKTPEGKNVVNKLAPQIDHVFPIKRGGAPLDIDNCRLTHEFCNNKKKDRTLDEIDFRDFEDAFLGLKQKKRKVGRRFRSWLEEE